MNRNRKSNRQWLCSDERPAMAVRWLSTGLAALVLLLGVLALSPDSHGELHDDAADPSHACVITLAAHGFCDLTPAPVQVFAPQAIAATTLPTPAGFDWRVPSHWHAQALAPPARGC